MNKDKIYGFFLVVFGISLYFFLDYFIKVNNDFWFNFFISLMFVLSGILILFGGKNE